MNFTGLPVSTLLTVAAVAGGLTVVFYILKLRRRPVAVPFSMIWQQVLRDKEATSWFSRLKRLLSLLLQLAILALIVLALGDPRMSANLLEGRNLVVLVDGSASMKATDVEPTRMDVAKQELKKLVGGLGGSDRMLIAQMDVALTPLSTMTGDISELELAVDQLRASDTRADLKRGLSFAMDSLRDQPRAEIIVISDGVLGDVKKITSELDLGEIPVRFVPVGKTGKNVAITQFSVRRYPLDKARYEVMLEIVNTNQQPVDVELSLFGDGQVVDVTELRLGPNERLPRFYKDLAGASRTLEARIRLADGSRDNLPADDHAYALMPERRRSRVLVVTPGNTYLEAALLLDEYLDVEIITAKEYPPAEKYDVTIFDSVAPALAKNTGAALYLNPPEQGSPVKLGRKIKMFGFDRWDKKSPVLRWIAPADIQVAEGHALIPEKGDRVIGESVQGAILVEGRRQGRPFVALGFDPRASDFVLRVAWPLFVLNTINRFVEEDTGYISSYRTGDVWRIPVPGSARTASLKGPSGKLQKVPVKEGHAVYLGSQAGFYSLDVQAEPAPVQTMFAANLSDLAESHIEPQKALSIGDKPATAAIGFKVGVRRELWIYLVLLVLAATVIEWLSYHRRWTV